MKPQALCARGLLDLFAASFFAISSSTLKISLKSTTAFGLLVAVVVGDEDDIGADPNDEASAAVGWALSVRWC